MKRHEFIYSSRPTSQRERTKQILTQHPEVKLLIGKNPLSFLAIPALVAIQFGMAFLMRNQPWWVILCFAYLVGAFFGHALYVMIHECSHRLIFKSIVANRLAGILADLPQIVPTAISFERFHLKHHAFQGVYRYDLGIPSYWEARVFDNGWYGKGLWMLFFPILQTLRLARYGGVYPLDGWTVLNWAMQILSGALVLIFLGPWALFYLAASFFFSIGLHPLGARWISEHTLVREGQETYSYYGILNRIMFNVGYHTEHHDFTSIPWNRLPKLRAAAPDFYAGLASHRSLGRVWFRFLLDRDCSLFSAVVREAPAAALPHDRG